MSGKFKLARVKKIFLSYACNNENAYWGEWPGITLSFSYTALQFLVFPYA
jgi:hypothetical protein